MEGSFLGLGESLCEIAGADGLIARVPVRERRLDEIQPGQPVELKLIPFPFETFTGRVIALAPASAPVEGGAQPSSEPLPGLEFTDFEVIVGLDGQPEGLLAGMSGRAKIHLGRATLASRTGRALRRWFESQVW